MTLVLQKTQSKSTMAEPDELYTLRAQFWLGHYQTALDEGKSIARRPMSPQLKEEREAFVARCSIALKDYSKVMAGDTPGELWCSGIST
jgi:coatomer subunit epsilon